MKYVSVSEIAKEWIVSERTVRNYAKNSRIPGAKIEGRSWKIPVNSQKPERLNKKNIESQHLLEILRAEKKSDRKGGIYHRVQVDLTYNSNRIEGSQLSHDQTRYIYETNTIGLDEAVLNVDDIVETANHFRAIDYIIDNANRKLSESLIKELHRILKNGTSDSRKDWFVVGNYKKIPNEVGGKETTSPEKVAQEMKRLIKSYNNIEKKTLHELLKFHYQFETIHPFQDGNGRVGRLILFKECLHHDLTPFIITDDLKLYYYRGLKNWNDEEGYLVDTVLTAQDTFKKQLDYFRIPYQ